MSRLKKLYKNTNQISGIAKYNNNNKVLSIVFIDLGKAYHRVSIIMHC